MSFCAAVNCMDGRVQLPVIEYLTARLGVRYVDVISEAGPVRVLAESPGSGTADAIMSRVQISTAKHGAKTVAVVAHDDCTGNPVGKVEQLDQLMRAVGLIAERFPGVTVLGLWVDDEWTVEEIARREPSRV
ncbi:MAG: hypothetical protein JXB46_03550 [Candidatus Eisenbacteria bacterium]|nr:hypothetical protein [Candidatus Eisenbacteria bacterium]